MTWHTQGFNHSGEVVMDFRRTNLVTNARRPLMSYMTEERTMIQQTAREFAMKEVLPVANELDPVEGSIPMELREKMAEIGYFGIVIAQEDGGLGLACSSMRW